MLIYEKKVEENNELVRHLFYAVGTVPTNDDVQLSYKDDEGTAVSGLTVTSKLLDDGHGGIKTEDGEAVNVWAGNVNIIPGDLDGESVDNTSEEPDEPGEETPSNDNSGDEVTEPEEPTEPEEEPLTT